MRTVFRRCCYDLFILSCQVKGVYEINICPFINAFQQTAFVLQMQTVPSDLRYFEAIRCRYAFDLSRKDRKTFYSRTFFTAVKQKLQPHANSQKRFAAVDRLMDHIHQPVLFQVPHGIAEYAYSGKNDFLRAPDLFNISGQYGCFPQCFNCFYDAFGIACVII